MAISKGWTFFDETSTSTTSNYASADQCGAMNLEITDLGTSSAFSLQVEGCVDLEYPDTYYPIKAVKLGSFQATDTITTTGMYVVPLVGMQKVRMTATQGSLGLVKAFGSFVN